MAYLNFYFKLIAFEFMLDAVEIAHRRDGNLVVSECPNYQANNHDSDTYPKNCRRSDSFASFDSRFSADAGGARRYRGHPVGCSTRAFGFEHATMARLCSDGSNA